MSTKKTTNATQTPSNENLEIDINEEETTQKSKPRKTKSTGYQAFSGHYGDKHKAGRIGNSPRGTRRSMGSR